MPSFEWKGRDRGGRPQGGVLVADSKDAVLAVLRRQQIVPITVKEKGKEIALPKLRARHQREDAGGLHAPVLGDDRRRPAARAVPPDPRRAAGQQGVPAHHPAGPRGRRVRLLARQRHEEAPAGVQRPLRQHGGGGRGGRHPRHHPAAPGDLHREGGPAEGAGQVGDDLPDRRDLASPSWSSTSSSGRSSRCSATLFESLGAELPLPTRIVVALSKFVGRFWWLIIGAVVAARVRRPPVLRAPNRAG